MKVFIVLRKQWEEQHPDCSFNCDVGTSCYVHGVYSNIEVAKKVADKISKEHATWGEVVEETVVEK